MKPMVLLAPLVLALASLCACAPDPRASAEAAPYRSPTGSRTGSPQPANSLPDGAAVNSPVIPSTGIVGSTPVAPYGASSGRRGSP